MKGENIFMMGMDCRILKEILVMAKKEELLGKIRLSENGLTNRRLFLYGGEVGADMEL